MVNQIDFEGWVKFAGKNLFDYAALETHPLTGVLVNPPSHFSGTRSEYIYKIFAEAIEQLKPSDREFNPNQPEWRPYLILHQRYIEGLSSQELATSLNISDRQLRRDQHRAMAALTLKLWELLEPPEEYPPDQMETAEASNQFEVNISRTDAGEVIRGVYAVLKRRLDEEKRSLEINIPAALPKVLTDRVILRQILISLINHALRSSISEPVNISAADTGTEVMVKVSLSQPVSAVYAIPPGQDDLVETVRFWARNINARYNQKTGQEVSGNQRIEFSLGLPKADQKVILVVDDQEPAISLFQRYLFHRDFHVVGETEATQVVAAAIHMHPVLIILDVMMPKVDGWELLQTLKTHEITRGIPVLICSAWEEPELARSLGAAGFLKKPVTQKVFLDELKRIGILAQDG